MLTKKNQSKKHQNSKNCVVWEYPLNSKLMTGATAKIDGRYPDSGKSVNLECEEMYYIISGPAVIYSDKGVFNIKEGDVYLFDIGEKYYVEGKKLFLFLANAPPWTYEQYKQIK